MSSATQADAKGRLNAVDVRFAGQRIAAASKITRRTPMRVPRVGIAVAFLLLAIALMVMGIVPGLVAPLYVLMSVMSYMAYVLDKDAAGKRRQRTPEATLHLLDALGGWPGALIAQQQMRHKTMKVSFQTGFWISVLIDLVAVGMLWYSGIAAQVSASVL